MKTVFKVIGIALGFILVVYLFAAITGLIDLQFYKYFGTQQANVQRDIFKENKSYIEGMASDLAKYQYELNTEKDENAQSAIKQLIRSKYADFDINNLQDKNLQQFLKGIRGGY